MKYSFDPLEDGKSSLELVDWMGSDASVVQSARVSYSGDSPTIRKGNRLLELFTRRYEKQKKAQAAKDMKLIDFLVRNRHTSPLEHTYVTFHVKCPLFVRSQWHRHRMWSYNEISRRYTNENIEFYLPDAFDLRKQNDKGNKQGSYAVSDSDDRDMEDLIRSMSHQALGAYDTLVGAGYANEQARMVLPQNLYTRFYASANLHSIAHFVNLRSDEHAQPEIRVFSEAIEKVMRKLYPDTWGAVEQHWFQS